MMKTNKIKALCRDAESVNNGYYNIVSMPTSAPPQTTYESYLSIPNTSGPTLIIPLAKVLSQNVNDTKCANQLILCQARWHVCPRETNADSVDIRDVLQLSDWVRDHIWQTLINNKILFHGPWMNALQPEIKFLVKQWMQSKHNPPLQPGRLYLYRNGYLWRELVVDKNNTYADVDLHEYAGLDQRPATGIPERHFCLPWILNNQKQSLEICYSSIPWSWARINYFGGMDPQDSRLIDNTTYYAPSPQQLQQAKLARYNRFERIDFTNLSEHMPIGTNYKLSEKNKLIQILVPDPMGLMQRIQRDLAKSWYRFFTLLQTSHENPLFKSAITAYHLYFGTQATPPVEIPRGPISTPPNSLPPIVKYYPKSVGNKIYLASQYLSKEHIETVLGTKARRQLRALIRVQQQLLVSTLHDIYTAGQEEYPAILPDYKENKLTPIFTGTTFNQVLSDYFAAAVDYYEYAFINVDNVLSLVHTDPSKLDYQLELSGNADIVNDPPGIAYIKQLLNTQHPIHDKLFPTQEKINIYQPDNTEIADHCIMQSENQGHGKFREKTFQCLFQASLKNQPYVIVRNDQNDIPNIDTYEDNYTEVINRIDNTLHGLMLGIKKSARSFARYLRDSNGIITVETPSPKQYLSPLAATISIARATGSFNNLYYAHAEPSISSKAAIRTYIPGLLSVYRYSEPHALASVVPADAIPIYTINKEQAIGFAQHHGNFGAALRNESINTKHWLTDHLSEHPYAQFDIQLDASCDEAKARDKILDHFIFGRKSLGLIISAITLFNLEEASQALFLKYTDKSKIRRSVEEITANLAVIVSIQDTCEAFLGTQKVNDYLINKPILGSTLVKEYTWLNMLASPLQHTLLIFASIGVFLAIYDSINDLYVGEHGESIGQGINALGASVLLAGHAGKAISNQANKRINGLVKQFGRVISRATIKEYIYKNELNVLMLTCIESSAIGWLGTLLLIIGSLSIEILKDDNITRWAKHGPFSNTKHWLYPGKYAAWEAQPQFACQALLNIIMQPQINNIYLSSGSEAGKYCIVEVLIPQFIPQIDMLDVRAVWEWQRQIHYNDIGHNFWIPVGIAKPSKILQIMSKGPIPKIIKMHYYYPIDTSQYPKGHLRLQAKVRLLLGEEHFILPCEEFPTQESNDLSPKKTDNTINRSISGWNYAPKPCICS